MFRPTQVDGKVAVSGPSDVKLHGVFRCMAANTNWSFRCTRKSGGDHWKGTAKFEVPYIQWGLKDPSNFLLKVKPSGEIELELAGALKQGP